jgi:diguanylate cyclase (GGDEF)-like protein
MGLRIGGNVNGLQAKLAGAFLLVSVGIAAFVALAVRMDRATIERAARLEAEHVAMTLASPKVDDAIHKPEALQAMLDIEHSLRQRDAFIVDVRRIGIADVHRDEVGMMFRDDPGNEVGLTIADGAPRAFLERTEQHPQGELQIVVPFRAVAGDPRSPIVGATVVEYTQIYQDLLAAERVELYGIAAGGAACVLFSLLFGWRVARSLSARIQTLQRGLTAIDAGDYAVRIVDRGKDEIGALGAAFNRMAAEVEQRTVDLSRTNAMLAQEIRERQLAAERIEFLAYYDALTGLPNRSLFARQLEQGVAQAKRHGQRLAVLSVDLDRFKQINDTLGHDAGDLLLKEVAQRLSDCPRRSDAVACLGGDRFVVMLTELGQENRATMVAEKILGAISRSVTLNGVEFRITASIGISSFPDNGSDERELLQYADIALSRAKEDGKNMFRFYNEQLNANSLERLTLESSLRHALEHDQFLLHYQPKIDLKAGAIAGVEALLRWKHPELGMIPPVKFIPIAEETGLIAPIGEWVLRTACEQHALWRRAGLSPAHVAVNLSPRQFGDDLLLETIESILAETGMGPDMLQLEITESMLMQNPQAALETLTALKKIGVRLAIDDFGTGYSSLSNLKLFPIDTIKVDRSFIRNLPDDVDDRGIADAIIAMGRTLGLTVVAEGVETRQQAEFLRAHGCDQYQGFYFSKPVPAVELAELLRRATSTPRVAETAS